MRNKHPEILKEIRENPKNKINDDLAVKTHAALKEFATIFDGEVLEA